MADYWIKLYHEIIDDPKMATMPDRLWRRAVEMFLLAGKLDSTKEGVLPDTRQLAWCLRVDSDTLQTDLEQLHGYGIIEPIANGWLVRNFAVRQASATNAERVKQHRERKQKAEYYGNESVTNRYIEQNRTESEQNRADTPAVRELIIAYQDSTGILHAPDEDAFTAYRDMVGFNIKPADIVEGVKWLKKNGKRYEHPEYVINSAKTAKREREKLAMRDKRDIPPPIWDMDTDEDVVDKFNREQAEGKIA
jgi:hypothetical protein